MTAFGIDFWHHEQRGLWNFTMPRFANTATGERPLPSIVKIDIANRQGRGWSRSSERQLELEQTEDSMSYALSRRSSILRSTGETSRPMDSGDGELARFCGTLSNQVGQFGLEDGFALHVFSVRSVCGPRLLVSCERPPHWPVSM